MRVLTATHYWLPHIGGVEFEALEQSRRLVARGHDVTVLSSRISDDRPLSFDDGFPVHKVAASNFLEEKFRLPYPLYSPKLFSTACELARDADVVLAHTHTFMSTAAAARAARRERKPFVLIQNNPYIEYRFPLNLVQKTADATIARYTMRSANRLIAISNFTAEYVRRLAPDRPVTLMHLGTDRERFSPVDGDRRVEIRRRLGLPVDAFVALTVRRLFFRNGLDTLLEATVALRDRANLHVVIGGSGPERGEIEQRIRNDGLANVHLTGFIPDADLPDYYRAADVFVLPTRTAEGFGLVVMEAAASGIPSIATDSGAPREIVDDGATGLLVPPGAPRDLAAAIARLHDDPDLLATMSRAAFDKSAEFTWDRSIDVLERVLAEAVEQGPDAAVSPTASGPALVDARWLGIGGPGRVAEQFLQGLAEIRPPGRWVIWGPDAVSQYVWDDAVRVPNRFHPKAWYSQREYPGPRDFHPRVAYYAHHLRPGWSIAPAEVTTVHDTIPFRYPPSRALAPLMRAYITWMARRSTLVVTDSEFSKQCLQDDIGLDADRISVLALAIDHDTAARVRTLRGQREQEARVLFVGRDAPHKNLDRLVRGFAISDFARGGAVLTLAGVDGPAEDRLRSLAAETGARVELPGVVSQPDLEDLLVSAALVAQPSLEEGFGLPVAEALAAGIPVAMSTAAALVEITRGADVETFDPQSVDAIAAAIDRVVASPGPVPELEWPKPVDFVASVLDAMTRAELLA